jgi:hypothetical protein
MENPRIKALQRMQSDRDSQMDAGSSGPTAPDDGFYDLPGPKYEMTMRKKSVPPPPPALLAEDPGENRGGWGGINEEQQAQLVRSLSARGENGADDTLLGDDSVIKSFSVGTPTVTRRSYGTGDEPTAEDLIRLLTDAAGDAPPVDEEDPES